MSALGARPAIIGAFVLAASHAAHGQRPHLTIGQLEHTVWTVQDGAPPFVTSFAQSADGMLWIASATGLYRFDGVSFERFQARASQTFPSGAISTIHGLPDSSLWIGFSGGDVSVLAKGRVVNYTVRDGIPEGRITGFARDSAGDTWVASESGLARLHDGRWRRMGPEQEYPGGETGDLFVDRRGALWASTPVALFVLPRGGTRFARHGLTRDPKERAPQSPREAPDGSVWGASLSFGLTRLSDTAGRPTPLRSAVFSDSLERATMLIVDRHANAWIVTPGTGVNRLRLPAEVPREPSRRQPGQSAIQAVPLRTAGTANAMLEDREGNVWLGTVGGIERFRETKLTPADILPRGVRGPSIAAAADGYIWLGRMSQPVSLMGNEARRQPGAPAGIVYAYRDLEGGAWFAGRRGLWHAAPSRSPFAARFAPVMLPVGPVIGIQAVARTLDGDLWVAIRTTPTATVVFRRRAGRWSRAPQPSRFSGATVRTMVADSAGRVWAAYNDAIAVAVGDSTRVYSGRDGLRVGRVTALWVSGPRLWIGGSEGLAMMEDDRFRTIAATEALRGVSGIVETRNGDLWLNSFDGVTHFPAAEVRHALQDSAYRARFERFDQRDGLVGQASQALALPTAIQGTDGRIWFSTTTAVAWIDPGNIRRNTVPPPVQVRTITAGGVRYEAGDHVSLPERTTQLQVAYTSPSLARPDRIRFRYRLSTVDTAWVEAETRREAFYTNLGPGSYRFRVIAANEDSVWNEAGASIDFDIPPSFTETKAFIALIAGLMAAGLVGAGWLFAFWRQRQMARTLHAKYEGQLAERARVARDLHDTLLGDMTGVALQLGAAARRAVSANDNAGIVELLSSLRTQVERTATEARRSISAMRIVPDESLPVHQQLDRVAQRIVGDTGITVRVEHKGSPRRYSPDGELQVVGIATEAMTNARLHAKCKTVTVTCAYAAEELRVRVRDDGRGFDAARATPSGHWGLVGMRERAASIGAALSVTSAARTGTEVLLVWKVSARS